MKKFNYEYNDGLIGYVVSYEDGRRCNFQFEKIFSNHPEPDFELTHGCTGDTSDEQFAEDELAEMSEYLNSQEDVKETISAFNKAFYENEDFREKIWSGPMDRWEILEAAETVEE
jgi:hypothetical protein